MKVACRLRDGDHNHSLAALKELVEQRKIASFLSQDARNSALNFHIYFSHSIPSQILHIALSQLTFC
jgi:hypothetical protein